MNYVDIRPQIRSGDLLAFSHRSWKTWQDIKIQLVRFFTQSEYAHVAIAWVAEGRVFAIEAVKPKVRIYPLSKLGDFYYLPMNVDWTTEVGEFTFSHIGEDYSEIKAIQGFFKPLTHSNLWECAQLVIEILALAGKNLGNKATPTAVVYAAQQLHIPSYLIINK